MADDADTPLTTRPNSLTLRPLRAADGAALWQLTKDSQVLDLNSSYAYLLWARDFADTSVIAELDGEPVGFVSGYLRPESPTTLMVWQVAVSEAARGRGLASKMLDALVARTSAETVETTITADNEASIALFTRFAQRHGASREVMPLFTDRMYPDGHDTEYLHRIAPLSGPQIDPIRKGHTMDTTVFSTVESEVRSYSRGWPTVFTHAKGCVQTAEDGTEYLDFFSGAGALNYGHNHPKLQAAVAEYLTSDAVVHSLDMMTPAKREFLQTFKDVILDPRGLDYKVMFPGPTGTNTVEAALKLARKVTGRQHILSFTNAFHGMTLGSLSVTGNSMKRKGAGIPLTNSSKIPYDDYFDGETADFLWLERVLEDSGSGVDKPAAVIVETVQGEGGVRAARLEWLRGLSELCAKHEILLIVDDVQAGCGRTGTFFSFEEAGFTPDIVCVSKSISGFGLPMALTLFRPELDVWTPGEHNGTFRGNNLAFVTATATLKEFWADDTFQLGQLAEAIATLHDGLEQIADSVEGASVRGRGLLAGVRFEDAEVAGKVAAHAFDNGLLVETSGPDDEVLKVMPALTTSRAELERGLGIIAEAVTAVTGTEVDYRAGARELASA